MVYVRSFPKLPKRMPFVMKPETPWEKLEAWEQDHIERFLLGWKSQTQDPKAKWAMAAKNPKTIAWLRAQRPGDTRFRQFAQGGAVLTEGQRAKIGLPRGAGPAFPGRETTEEARKRYAAVADIAAEEYDRAFKKRGRGAGETAEQTRARYAAAADIAAEEYARAFAEARVPRESPEELRARVRQSAEITAEEYGKAFDKTRRRETPQQLRARVRRSATITAQEYERAFRVSREKGGGTPAERAALARLKSSRYSVSVAVRVFDEGRWAAMERLDPGCTERVFNRYLEGETSKWAGRLLHGKAPYEMTRRDVERSGLNAVQREYVAAANKGIRDQFASLGIRVGRARPVSDFLKSFSQLGARARGRGDVFWLTIPGPLPLRVPMPAVSTWAKPRGVMPQRLERHWEPLRERQRRMREAGLLPAEAAFGTKALEKKGAPAKIPVAKAVGQAMPQIIGTAIQTGAIPAQSGLAEVYGSYALSQMAKSALVQAGVGAAVAGPLGIVIGMASLFSGWKRARGARKERRAREAGLRRMAAARFLTGQVGYVPRTAATRYVPKRKRGYARPFSSLYGSRLGLAAGTRTPLARI